MQLSYSYYPWDDRVPVWPELLEKALDKRISIGQHRDKN